MTYDGSSEGSEVDNNDDYDDDNDNKLDISETSAIDYESDDWDIEIVESFRSLKEKFDENETPDFMAADSLRYADDASSEWKQASDDGRGYDNVI